MIKITIDSKAKDPNAEVCHLMVTHGQALKDGDRAEIVFSGAVMGQVAITRTGTNTPDDTLFLTGMLEGRRLNRFPVPLRWAGAMPEQNTYAPDDRLMGHNTRSAPNIGDLYAGGCRFSPETAPRAKLGPERAASRAVRLSARKATQKWEQDLLVSAGFLPADARNLSSAEKREARQAWLATLPKSDRALFSRRKDQQAA